MEETMNSEILKSILDYIDEHIHAKITLFDLSQLAGYSPFYFSVVFSERMGVSVTTYIRIRKLQYAMGELLKGEKVIDVAYKFGFESHEGFTRSFTKLFGSTPKVVRKYLKTYEVPPCAVPKVTSRKGSFEMKITKNLAEDMHQIVFAFLQESMNEAKAGCCTEINIYLQENNRIQISDNGRGIPLSNNQAKNQEIISKILAGYPITKLDYERMEELNYPGLKVAGSLCEILDVIVYRNSEVYSQSFVRGIAQQDVKCATTEHEAGMEIMIQPDKEIFGEIVFSKERIEQWIDENAKEFKALKVNIL